MTDTKAVVERKGERTLVLIGEPVTADEIIARRNMVLDVIQRVMVQGVHYGIIPGTEKKDKEGRDITPKSLFKEGAELLSMVFGVRGDTVQERHVDGGNVRVDSIVRFLRIDDSKEVGMGVGTASTGETKWAWKRCYDDDEWESTEPSRRREIRKKGRNGFYTIRQVRQPPEDTLNTILQMSEKRAYVQGVRRWTACSDILKDDLEGKKSFNEDDDVDDPGPDHTGPEDTGPSEPKTGTSRAPNGNGGSKTADPPKTTQPTPTWVGMIERVNPAPFVDSKKIKRTKYFITGDDKTQFQTIFDDKGNEAMSLYIAKKRVKIFYTTSQYGNDLLNIFPEDAPDASDR